MAASLNTSGVTKEELAKGKFNLKTISSIKEQLSVLKMNREKNHNQITDNIYEREGHRYEEMYHLFLAEKNAYESKGTISQIDLQNQRQRVESLNERVDKIKEIEDEFAAQPYFKYITMDTSISKLDKRQQNR